MAEERSLIDDIRLFNEICASPDSTLMRDLWRDAKFFGCFGAATAVGMVAFSTLGLTKVATEMGGILQEHATPITIITLTIALTLMAVFIANFPLSAKQRIEPYVRHIMIRVVGYSSVMFFFVVGFSLCALLMQLAPPHPYLSAKSLQIIGLMLIWMFGALFSAFLVSFELRTTASKGAKLAALVVVLGYLSLAIVLQLTASSS